MRDNNPIQVGFSWQQAFQFPAEFFQEGDQIYADIRRYASKSLRRLDSEAEAIVSLGPSAGTVIDGDLLYLSLTAAQTKVMKPTEVVTSFVLMRNGVETSIGQIVTIPVVIMPTRPRK